ncbi:hypothetical protein CMQ_6729 [Grosmannia clavigera kw1407]|uniref:Uncharacterized protein n=1 Tax=Grosmannia clavigera (strain kw1407 / UAMH 11150) TaxID=655863 RepID=F0X6J8_GROCL|nr:uncharacterized protein CMQ_6729 [Grosmannia clavigera kw1407]EFX06408.1 hypothetical protein CMQ_6729 [Grosmannia clavigera kw1407]
MPRNHRSRRRGPRAPPPAVPQRSFPKEYEDYLRGVDAATEALKSKNIETNIESSFDDAKVDTATVIEAPMTEALDKGKGKETCIDSEFMTKVGLPSQNRMEPRQAGNNPTKQAAAGSTRYDSIAGECHEAGPATLYSPVAGPSKFPFIGKTPTGPTAGSLPRTHIDLTWGQQKTSPVPGVYGAKTAGHQAKRPVLGSFQKPTQLSADSPSFHPQGATPAALIDVANKGDRLLQSIASSSTVAMYTGNHGVLRARDELNRTAAYCSMREKADFAGWGKSPFLPQSPIDFVAHQRQIVAAEMKRNMNRVAMLEATQGKHKAMLTLDFQDGLSPMLVQKTSFNDVEADYQKYVTDWPTPHELQMSGTSLPLPQKKQAESGEQAQRTTFCTQEDETRTWDWLSPFQAASVRAEDPATIDEDTLGSWMRDLMKAIDQDDE